MSFVAPGPTGPAAGTPEQYVCLGFDVCAQGIMAGLQFLSVSRPVIGA
jgi:hypothetical protein